MNQDNSLKQPFFARFLQSQQTQKENDEKNQLSIWSIITNPLKDLDQTMKYPSDNDEDIFI